MGRFHNGLSLVWTNPGSAPTERDRGEIHFVHRMYSFDSFGQTGASVRGVDVAFRKLKHRISRSQPRRNLSNAPKLPPGRLLLPGEAYCNRDAVPSEVGSAQDEPEGTDESPRMRRELVYPTFRTHLKAHPEILYFAIDRAYGLGRSSQLGERYITARR